MSMTRLKKLNGVLLLILQRDCWTMESIRRAYFPLIVDEALMVEPTETRV